MATIRIAIAAERSLFSDGLRRLLERESDVSVAGEPRNGDEALRIVRELQPEVLLVVDDETRTMAGLIALRRIQACGAPVRTIFLTSKSDRGITIKALQLGARAVVAKKAAPALLLNSIRAVMDGLYCIDDQQLPDLREAFCRLMPKGDSRFNAFGLSGRDLEIVAMVGAGLTNRKIAHSLSITEDAVKHHLTRIFDKLSVSSRLELARFAAHHHLLDRT